mmetsp:Transcript_81881/g.136940  ORF Transcript_81881/g.136940 Transcript_81881/m.136940 type:complete len:85 (+) Transcript_81881:527-781(+)
MISECPGPMHELLDMEIITGGLAATTATDYCSWLPPHSKAAVTGSKVVSGRPSCHFPLPYAVAFVDSGRRWSTTTRTTSIRRRV